MPNIKPVVRSKELNADHKANIKIRVSHNKKVRYIATTHYIEPKFMGSDGIVKEKYAGQLALNRSLRMLVQEYDDVINRIGPDVVYIDINTLVAKLRMQHKHGDKFMSYMRHRIEQLEKEKRYSYAESYQVTLNHLETFTKKTELEFKEITVAFLNDFKAHLSLVCGARVNTIRIYLNNIRAVMYHAIDAEIIKADISPFRKFKIEQEKTVKRSLDLEDLKKLIRIRPEVTGRQQMAIDIFMLLFYLLGINLKDLLYLKPDCIYKDRLHYKRFKTGREYSIKVFPQAREIIERYKGGRYLLRFLERKEKISPGRMEEANSDIRSQINKLFLNMKKCGKIDFKVTTYSARHSWATIAAKMGIRRDVISHALGHGIDTMTDIYIDYDLKEVDKANARVINKLKS